MDVSQTIARAMRMLPERQLDGLLRTPMRRVVLDGIFRQMPRYVDPERAGELNARVRWSIEGAPDGEPDIYELTFDGGRCSASRGVGSLEPQLTITLDAPEFVRLATGISDPMQAFFAHRVALTGDLGLAARVLGAFLLPPVQKPD
jgi:predicted lipid carrier protein YhbT